MEQAIAWGDIAGEGVRQESLTADMVKGRRTVLTIESAAIVRFKDKETGDDEASLFVTFVEFPSRALKCNKGQGASFKRLADAGILDATNMNKWAGKRVPLEKYETKYNGKTYEKLRVSHPDDYAEFLAAYDKVAKGR